jgi:hypothetical protein
VDSCRGLVLVAPCFVPTRNAVSIGYPNAHIVAALCARICLMSVQSAARGQVQFLDVLSIQRTCLFGPLTDT